MKVFVILVNSSTTSNYVSVNKHYHFSFKNSREHLKFEICCFHDLHGFLSHKNFQKKKIENRNLRWKKDDCWESRCSLKDDDKTIINEFSVATTLTKFQNYQ